MTSKIYSDADFAGSVINSRSTTGYCTFIGGSLILWRSKKQKVVSLSSAEAENRAMVHGVEKAIWIQGILEELKLYSQNNIKVYHDKKSAIAIAHNLVQL